MDQIATTLQGELRQTPFTQDRDTVDPATPRYHAQLGSLVTAGRRLPAPKSRGPLVVRIVAGRSGLRALLSRPFQVGVG